MKKSFILFLFFGIVFLAIAALADDDNPMSTITVKNSEKNSGVITLQITKDTKTFELTCNEGMPSCTALSKGNYRMEQLPKNRGVYDCQNVRIYAQSAPEDSDKLGEYCLIAK